MDEKENSKENETQDRNRCTAPSGKTSFFWGRGTGQGVPQCPWAGNYVSFGRQALPILNSRMRSRQTSFGCNLDFLCVGDQLGCQGTGCKQSLKTLTWSTDSERGSSSESSRKRKMDSRDRTCDGTGRILVLVLEICKEKTGDLPSAWAQRGLSNSWRCLETLASREYLSTQDGRNITSF